MADKGLLVAAKLMVAAVGEKGTDESCPRVKCSVACKVEARQEEAAEPETGEW